MKNNKQTNNNNNSNKKQNNYNNNKKPKNKNTSDVLKCLWYFMTVEYIILPSLFAT